MGDSSQIIIGSGLQNVNEKKGKYVVLFADTRLTFDNLREAVLVYKDLIGEVYIWDITRTNESSKLLEARIFKYYNATPDKYASL